jgi:hypothetical protein
MAQEVCACQNAPDSGLRYLTHQHLEHAHVNIVPIQRVPGAFPPEVNRPRPEADHTPPTSNEVKSTYVDL